MAARLFKRLGRSRCVASGDVITIEVPTEHLAAARQRGRRREITYWRQLLTVTAAYARARAGDRTAERRLAWRDHVVTLRWEMGCLWSRFQALDSEITRLIRRGPPCASCSGRLDRVRQNLDEVVTRITELLEQVVTWREYRHRAEATARDADAWLRRQLAGLEGKGGA
jgi:hypothetical protein